MIIYTLKVMFPKCQFLMCFFSLLECKSRSHGKCKNCSIKCKTCAVKRINTSLEDLSIDFNNHGRHGLLSFLSSMPILVLVI